MTAGDIVPAIVLGASHAPRAAPAGSLLLRAGTLTVEVPKAGYAWTRKVKPDFLREGDLVQVRLTKVEEATAFATGDLEQDPVVEGAVLAIDNATGQIRTMIGGSDFSRSKFNRSTQALRQMGSTFKPIVYTAAIDRGYTPTSIIVDAPVAFPAGPGSRSTRRRTTTAPSRARSRCATRSSSRATCRRSSCSTASARPSPSTTRSDSGSPASSSRTSRWAWAQRRRRCSRRHRPTRCSRTRASACRPTR